mgnify:CR=1 FL=1
MTMKLAFPSVLLALTCLLAACGTDTPEATNETPAAEAPPAGEAPAVEPPAALAPAVEPAAAEAPPANSETVTVAALRAGFEADRGSWMGTTRTVTGLYMNASSVGGQLNNITLVASRDAAFNETVMCAFGDNPPASVDLTQYDEVTVRGRVDSFFDRASLRDCAIVTP